MSIAEIARLPLRDKFQILDARRARVAAGDSTPHTWDAVSRITTRVAGGVIVTLLMISGVTQGQPAGPSADEPRIVKNDPARAFIQNKLNSITIPVIDFEDVTVEEAIDFLRIRAVELDLSEKDPAKKGIQFVVRYPAAAPSPVIRSLRLKNVPLADALKYVCDQTNFRYTMDDFAVTLSPKDPAGAEPAKPAEK